MKQLYSVCIAVALLLGTACAADSGAGGSQAQGASDDPAVLDTAMAGEGEERLAPPPEGGPDTGVTARVVQLGDGQITVLAAQLPEMDGGPGERPGGDGPAQRPEDPGDGEAPTAPPDGEPSGERPGGEDGGPGANFDGRGGMSFSDEQTTYSLAEDVRVVSGVGLDAQTLSAQDLEAGDIVRLELDGDGLVASITRMDPAGGLQPPSQPGSPELEDREPA